MSRRLFDEDGNEYFRSSGSGGGCCGLIVIGLIIFLIACVAASLQSNGILTSEQADKMFFTGVNIILYGCGAILALTFLWIFYLYIRDHLKEIIFLLFIALIIIVISTICSIL